MTTRGQNLRSSTPGQTPAAGARQPGEIWMTFPDIQFGYIDASRNAQKLIAVRFFSALANYAAGDFVVQSGKLWFAKGAIAAGAFNATQWSQIAALTDIPAALAAYLPLTGGVLTGALALAADPVSAAQAATKNYVDGKFAVAGQGIFLPLAGGALTGALTLSGPPTANLHAATKAYVDAGGAVPFLPLAGGTMTGPIVLAADPAAPLQPATKQYADKMQPLAGVADGSAASAGQVGQVLTATASGVAAGATTVAKTSVTLNLTAGDWDIWGVSSVTLGTGGATTLVSSLSLTNNTLDAVWRNQLVGPNLGASSNQFQPVQYAPLSVSAATPIYLVVTITYASGSCTLGGTIYARRRR
jgi:hypothetical protein